MMGVSIKTRFFKGGGIYYDRTKGGHQRCVLWVYQLRQGSSRGGVSIMTGPRGATRGVYYGCIN